MRLAPGGGSLGSGLSPRGAIPAGGLAGPRPPQANEKGPPQVSERGVGGTLPPPRYGIEELFGLEFGSRAEGNETQQDRKGQKKAEQTGLPWVSGR